MNRNISLITLNQFLTNTADSIFQIVLFWYVYHQTGSALSASLVTAISFTIQIFLSPLIGVLSDRYNPLTTMQVSFGILGLVGVIFAPVYFYLKSLIVIYIYFAVIIHTCCMMLEGSSKNRLIPLFVGEENVVKTNGYISSSGNLASLIGNSLGGGILAVISFAGVMLIHSGLYFLAAVILLFLIKVKSSQEKSEILVTELKAETKKSDVKLKKPKFFQEMLDGFKLLKSNRPLLKLVILSTVLNIAMLNASLLVVLVSDQYHGTSTIYGLFNMFGIISSIVIGLIIGKLTTKFKTPTLFAVGLAISGVATVLMGVTNIIAIGILLNMLVLASGAILRITFNSFMMICVEDKFRGRMMSLAIAISAIIVPAVSLLGGYLSDKFGVGIVYILSGSWIFIWTLFPLIDKDIREINLGIKQKRGEFAKSI
ncbi:MFS transporter [Neobacillus notoginsengisoli]|uniref:MFS transporter n=1 Tax=Neobacillus notoginsengisoli TaxID=1578198 RepID=A0A417YPW3_9BACI|nr:MFS transporter [Neobacillus notoginsengisoli]RHW36035.1 MFS transporter [Neobacillus notoginsengisoli]